MLRSALRVRVAAPFALAALTLGMPSVALAETTPTPSPTTSVSSTPTPSDSATQTPSTTPSPSASTATPSPKSSTSAPSPSASSSVPTDMQPFGSAASRRAERLAAASPASGLAGGYLARVISAGDGALSTLFDGEEYPDQGLTADGVLGLGAAGVGGAAAGQALDYLADEVDTYTGSGSEVYAGSTAKLLLTVAASGGDPSDFGGTDLVAKLDSTLTDEGKYADQSSFGDYSNNIGQSLAIIGRGRATAEVPSQAIEFLLNEQCPDGGFSASFTAGDCKGDTDATAFAVQALIGALSEPVAIADALDFLTGQQQASGGFRNVDGDLNSNTTGVAASAFAAASAGAGSGARAAVAPSDALASAQGYLSSLQLDCTYPAALRGGVAFAEGDRAELRAQDPEVVSIMTRATTQATLGLAGVSLLDVTVDTESGAAPSPSCATSTPTPTPTTTSSTPSSTPTTSGPSAPTSTPATTPPTNAGGTGGSDGGDLAYTGTEIGPFLGLGLSLFALGAVALVVARRRGGLHT